MSGIKAALAGLGLSIVLFAAGPAAAENVLRWGNADDAFTLDPHKGGRVHTESVQQQIYETLVAFESNMDISGHLALDWKPISPTTWEFQLRQGVRFHDGTPFTAEDVVFSIERAQADRSSFKRRLERVTAVEAIDPHTLRITTAVPDPLIWAALARVRIMSKAWTERHGTTLPEDLGDETYVARHANGTGPFMLEEFNRVGRIAMVRNPDWWGTARYPHNIDRIERIMLEDTEEGVQALLEGRIDFLQELPYDWIDQLERAPEIKVVKGPWLITAFLAFDLSRVELHSSNIKGKNPFQDKRVRQAFHLAIDVDTLIKDVWGGLVTPAGMLIPPGIRGYQAELAERQSFDPERARALLAKAGYPEGFRITLDCPSNWSIFLGKRVCRALAVHLGAVEVDVDVNFQPTGAFVQKTRSGKSDFYLEATTAMFDSQRQFNLLLRSNGAENFAGYSNPRVDELINAAAQEMVTYARGGLLEEIWRIVHDDLAYLPLYHPMVVWPMREDLEIPPDPWYRPQFRHARFKEIDD